MRATSTFFTALMAAAAIVPALAAPHRLHARAKVCPAKDDLGSALINESVAGSNLECSYAAAGACEYFLGNGNFSSGASTCPDAGVDAGSPEAGNGGSGAPVPAPSPAPVPVPSPAPVPVPVPSPVPVPQAPTTVAPPVAAPTTLVAPAPSPAPVTTRPVTAAPTPTPSTTPARQGSGAAASMRPTSLFIAGVSVLLGAFIMA